MTLLTRESFLRGTYPSYFSEIPFRQLQLNEDKRGSPIKDEILAELKREDAAKDQQHRDPLRDIKLDASREIANNQQQQKESMELQMREQMIREQQALREKQLKEQQARENELKEQQMARERLLKEQQLRDQQLKEQQMRDQQLKEQQLRDQQLRDQQLLKELQHDLVAQQKEREAAEKIKQAFPSKPDTGLFSVPPIEEGKKVKK